MTNNREYSDQLNNWSARKDDGSRDRVTAQTTEGAHSRHQALRFCHSSRLADRAFQALRQPWVQMRSGKRTWTQVLPVCQPTGESARHGLCAAGPTGRGPRIFGEFPGAAAASRRALRNRSGTASPSRNPINGKTAYPSYSGNNSFLRRQYGGCPPCQHASELCGWTTKQGGEKS